MNFETLMLKVKALDAGTPIPKPRSADSTRLVGWGTRRSEKALIYAMPNHKNSSKPHKKGVTMSELQQAFERLLENGDFTREWSNTNMPACRKEGTCNFTTIGGLFQIIGAATYDSVGMYHSSMNA